MEVVEWSQCPTVCPSNHTSSRGKVHCSELGLRSLASVTPPVLDPHQDYSWLSCHLVSWGSCCFGSAWPAILCASAVHRWCRFWGGSPQSPASEPGSHPGTQGLWVTSSDYTVWHGLLCVYGPPVLCGGGQLSVLVSSSCMSVGRSLDVYWLTTAISVVLGYRDDFFVTDLSKAQPEVPAPSRSGGNYLLRFIYVYECLLPHMYMHHM